MSETTTRIGPADHGRLMGLDEFARAERIEERVYELSRGIVTLVEICEMRHMLLVAGVRAQLDAFTVRFPEFIEVIASGNECKLTIASLSSERHPDLAIYLTPPPVTEDEIFWVSSVPEIVIQVATPSSRERDYDEKPDEFLHAGVKEYWIVDCDKRKLMVLRQSKSRWIEMKVLPPAIYRTRLLPGLAFSIASVFQSAGVP